MPAPKDATKKQEWKDKISATNILLGKVPPSRKGIKTPDSVKKKISQSLIEIGHTPPSALGLKRTEEFKKKVSKNHARYWKGKKLSKEAVLKRVQKTSGDKSCNWKGGITPENVKIRSSIEMGLWRNAVFARDGYTCQKYGTVGGKLAAHHILNFASSPELRFAIDNGITLSERAHREFHKQYGVKNNTKEQLQEFLKN